MPALFLKNIEAMEERLKTFQNYFRQENNKLEDDNAIINFFKKETNYKLLDELKVLTYYYFKEKIKGCKNCIVDYFFRIMYLNPQQLQKKQYKNKTILRGVVLQDYKNNYTMENVTYTNATPLLLEYYYENYPEYRVYFAEVATQEPPQETTQQEPPTQETKENNE